MAHCVTNRLWPGLVHQAVVHQAEFVEDVLI